MTAIRRDGSEDGYRKWLRENPRLDSVRASLSITDVDLLIHRYMTFVDKIGTRLVQCLMAVEWKAFGARPGRAQLDTMLMFNEAMRASHGTTLYVPNRIPPVCRCFNFGVHLCRMSGFDPSSSDTLWWDRRVITVDQLEGLIRFELHPDSLRPWTPRRHHLPPTGDGPTGVLQFEEEVASVA